MKKCFSCIILIVGILFILTAIGCNGPSGLKLESTSDHYVATLQMEKNPPSVGDNVVKITIKNQTKEIVTPKSVLIEYAMPAMPGMPPMNEKTNTVLQGSTYKATINLSMSGSWLITLKITTTNTAEESVVFNIDVR